MGYDPTLNRRKEYNCVECSSNWSRLKVLQNGTFSKCFRTALNWEENKSYMLISFLRQKSFPQKMTLMGLSIEWGINIQIITRSHKLDQKLHTKQRGFFQSYKQDFSCSTKGFGTALIISLIIAGSLTNLVYGTCGVIT